MAECCQMSFHPHEDFKVKVGQTLGIIHTGDAVPYSSVILRSG
jgi:D-ribose pyranase